MLFSDFTTPYLFVHTLNLVVMGTNCVNYVKPLLLCYIEY